MHRKIVISILLSSIFLFLFNNLFYMNYSFAMSAGGMSKEEAKKIEQQTQVVEPEEKEEEKVVEVITPQEKFENKYSEKNQDNVHDLKLIYSTIESFYDTWKEKDYELLENYFINSDESYEVIEKPSKDNPEMIVSQDIIDFELKGEDVFVKLKVLNDKSRYSNGFYHYIYMKKVNGYYKLSFVDFYEKAQSYPYLFGDDFIYFKFFYLVKSFKWSEVVNYLDIYNDDEIKKIKEEIIYTDEEIEEMYQTKEGRNKLMDSYYYNELVNIADASFIQTISEIDITHNSRKKFSKLRYSDDFSSINNDDDKKKKLKLIMMTTARQLTYENDHPEDEFYFVAENYNDNLFISLYNTDISTEFTPKVLKTLGIVLVCIIGLMVVIGVITVIMEGTSESREYRQRRQTTQSRTQTTTINESISSIINTNNNTNTTSRPTNHSTAVNNIVSKNKPKDKVQPKAIKTKSERRIQMDSKNTKETTKEVEIKTKRNITFDDE